VLIRFQKGSFFGNSLVKKVGFKMITCTTFSFLLSTTLVLSVNAASINVDFSDLAQPFEGIGALSGGGGVTRLLIDYEENLQEDIYDILFEPKKGASLQFIKCELGGDTQRLVVIFGTPVRRGVEDPNFQIATLIRSLFSSI